MTTTTSIRYTSGYKYQLEEDYETETGILPLKPGGNNFVQITLLGKLLLRAGYAWDGPSGPTVDTPDFMRASAGHDGLYQLIHLGFLSKDLHRKAADEHLRKVCLEDGMPPWRAWWVYSAVRLAGGQYIRNSHASEILTAP